MSATAAVETTASKIVAADVGFMHTAALTALANRGRPSRRRAPEPETPQEYADLAVACLTMAAYHAILAGELLLEAKARLGRGEWLRMFKGHPDTVARPLPFTVRSAQMLMRIAKHPILSNANHGSSLPTSWRCLYELSRLPVPVLERAIAEGRVHAGMERNRVAPMLVEMGIHKPLPPPRETPELGPQPPDDHLVEPEPPWSCRDAITRVRDVIEDEVARTSLPEHWEALADALRSIAGEIESMAAMPGARR